MTPMLIEPTDVLFFRDALPMAAGQGKGAGCRLPFPSTFHEALRSSLLRFLGDLPASKSIEGRPRDAIRSGNWHSAGHDGKTFIASRAFRSLKTIGPFPWRKKNGTLFPIPLDVVVTRENNIVFCELLYNPLASFQQAIFMPCCLPVSVAPAEKQRKSGWWNAAQMRAYISSGKVSANTLASDELWVQEHRVGIELDPATQSASEGQLYAATVLRPHDETCFIAWASIGDPAEEPSNKASYRKREQDILDALEWLLLGGEFRLARLRHNLPDLGIQSQIQNLLPRPSAPDREPCLLKWTLITPAIFTHGSLPGWCKDSRPNGNLPTGRVCFDDLPARAHLVAWRLDKPRAVSGWDSVEQKAKPTRLAVPEGSVYYLLCETSECAVKLAEKLHLRPRSDFYGEKGCGYGVVSFGAQMHKTSLDISELAKRVFKV